MRTSTDPHRRGWPVSRVRCSAPACAARTRRRNRQPENGASPHRQRDLRLLDGLANPGIGVARVRQHGARRVAHVARHEGVRRSSARSSAPSSGARSMCCCSICRRGRSGRSSTPTISARDLVRARDHPVRGVTGRRRALGSGAREGVPSRARLRREHERLLLPRLPGDQAPVRRWTRDAGAGNPLPRHRAVRSRAGAHCDQGIPFTELPDTPVRRALDGVAQRVLESMDLP